MGLGWFFKQYTTFGNIFPLHFIYKDENRIFSTLENIFCAFLAENIFVKVLIQDL